MVFSGDWCAGSWVWFACDSAEGNREHAFFHPRCAQWRQEGQQAKGDCRELHYGIIACARSLLGWSAQEVWCVCPSLQSFKEPRWKFWVDCPRCRFGPAKTCPFRHDRDGKAPWSPQPNSPGSVRLFVPNSSLTFFFSLLLLYIYIYIHGFLGCPAFPTQFPLAYSLLDSKHRKVSREGQRAAGRCHEHQAREHGRAGEGPRRIGVWRAWALGLRG